MTNPMRTIKIEKITLNIGTGMPGEKLDKATRLLAKITQRKPLPTTTKKRIPTWGIRPGLEIGCKVTLRGKPAEELLRKLLHAVDNTLPKKKFDKFGSFSFGIPEYLSIPGIEYDATIGIIGLEAAVTLQRHGFRIRRRLLKNKPIPPKHAISADEAIAYVQTTFGAQIT